MRILAICTMALLAGCSGKPKCQDDPPFYLKDTQFDCKAQEPKQ